ncbi:MAG: hypothetical protein HPZ86_01565 [Clostridia bacterium]|nr:hypothetical protein [Clostridia bacterium]
MKKSVKQGVNFAFAMTLVCSLGAGVAVWEADAATADVTEDGVYVGRAFDADYDKMLEDFAAAAPANTSAVYADDAVLSVTYNGDENSKTMDDAIYKISSGTVTATTPWPYTHLVFEMSSPDGSAKLGEMGLYLRELEDASTYGPVDFDADLLDPASATEIGASKTKIAVDMQTYATNAELTSMVNNGIAGYHLVAKAGQTGTVLLHDVYLANVDGDEIPDFKAQGTKALADFENGTKTDQKIDSSIYWCGSQVGVVIPKHVVLSDSSYTFAATEYEYSNLAVTVRGSGALSVNNKAWSALKGPDGEAVPAISADKFTTYVIDLASSGLGSSKAAFALAATGVVDVQNAFLTDMEVMDAGIQQIPFLDTKSAARVDDFTYASSVYDNYDDAVKDTANADAGVQYRLSYSNADKVAVANGALVFDATNLGDGYINFKTQSVKNISDYQYFVLKVKGEGAASLNGFRFGLGVDGTATPIVWGNGGLKSDTNLTIPALGGANPYTTADGWQYIVVDVAASGLTAGNTVDMYYSGEGKLMIDEIFYCNGLARGGEMQAHPIVTEETVIPETGYQYVWGGGDATAKIGGRYLTFEAKAENGGTLDGLRFAFDGSTVSPIWLSKNAEGTAVGMDGNLLPAVTGEYQTFIIDLEKSGVKDWSAITKIHLHATVEAGKVSVKNIGFATHKIVEKNTIDFMTTEGSYTSDGGAYKYLAGFDVSGNTAFNRYLAIKAKGTEGIMDDELRLEFVSDSGSVTAYWKDNETLLLDPDGAALKAITADYQIFYIDLDAIGVPRDFKNLHIHSTGNTTATLTIASIGFATTDAYKYADIVMPTFDSVKPTVNITTPATAVEGDKITVTYTASDNVTATEKLTVSIDVTLAGKPVELDADNAFVASEGSYIVTVTVTDEEGNTASATQTITVAKNSGGGSDSGDPNSSSGGGAEPAGGCNGCGSIVSAGIVGGSVLIAGVAALLLRKKKEDR